MWRCVGVVGMNDSKELEKIYEANKKIEFRHELKGTPPIAGSIAKKLINNCKKALKIISKYSTAHLEKDLKRLIEELEDELAERGQISTISYNLGARGEIHIAIEWVNRWTKK